METAMSTLTMRAAVRGFSLRRILARLAGRTGLRRQRAQLAALDAHLLGDIGITRAEALAEASRPVWDAPAHWVQ
jgi:uncharacterized protein YjiS (DUF1127 family)